ncbi:MAG: holo-[acyl-carrier protein] synthase [Gammaproteobacteria bacterium]|jgi:holo-[acyl-carrier protein] synthase
MPIIGVGTDIVEIARLQESVDKSDSMAKRILTSNEYKDYLALTNLPRIMPRQKTEAEDKTVTYTSSQARFLAKRFAAKEAAVKAIGNGIGNGVSWQQIEIDHHTTGQPFLKVNGHLELLFQQKGVQHTHLSISDEKHYATATVILES